MYEKGGDCNSYTNIMINIIKLVPIAIATTHGLPSGVSMVDYCYYPCGMAEISNFQIN